MCLPSSDIAGSLESLFDTPESVMYRVSQRTVMSFRHKNLVCGYKALALKNYIIKNYETDNTLNS